MHLRGVVGRGIATGPDGPYRLVREDERGPLGGRDLVEEALELTEDHVLGATALAFRQRLADADERDEASLERGDRFPGDLLVGFAEQVTSLGVTDQSTPRTQPP